MSEDTKIEEWLISKTVKGNGHNPVKHGGVTTMRQATLTAITGVMVDNDTGRGGSGWRYQCKSCGHEVGIDATFPEKCPGCRAGGWWGHLTPGKSQNDVKKDGDAVKTFSIKAPGGIKTQAGFLSRPDKPLVCCQPNSEGDSEGDYKPAPGNGRGRPRHLVPEDLIRDLTCRGCTSRVIAATLAERGIDVSYKTIQRRLQESFL